jgi:cholesterol transport system auxiliary component
MRYLLIGCLVFFSTGCSVTSRQPAMHDFGLPAPTSVQQGKASVSVNAPTWLWDNRIRYRLLFASPSQVSFYGLDRWIASPPELFEQLLAFSGNKGRDYTLVIRLEDFEQQFDTPDRARVVLNFYVEAYSDNEKIGSQAFYLHQPTKTADAAGAVAGFIDLAQQSTEKVRHWVAGLSNHKE